MKIRTWNSVPTYYDEKKYVVSILKVSKLGAELSSRKMVVKLGNIPLNIVFWA